MKKPTYKGLVVLYFNAQSSLISEYSSNTAKETLELWRKCNSWLSGEMPKDEMVEMYMDAEKQGDL